MYQIFPDRFARSGEPKPEQPAGRILREDWGGQPEWRPDAQGEIRNNDFFQGDLKGIEQRLDRLAELGVTCLYLNPIFEAHSNHRYDTADYRRIDPLLGTEEDFRSLTGAAAQLGIRVMLDGVFSHTGADSVYFNKEKRYPDIGAYQSPGSPYADGIISGAGRTITPAGGDLRRCRRSMNCIRISSRLSAGKTASRGTGCGRALAAGGWMSRTSCRMRFWRHCAPR